MGDIIILNIKVEQPYIGGHKYTAFTLRLMCNKPGDHRTSYVISCGYYHTILYPFRSPFLVITALPTLECSLSVHSASLIFINMLGLQKISTMDWLYCNIQLLSIPRFS